MPDNNSTSATGLAWTPLDHALGVVAREKSPTRALLLVNVCGFLMGYYAMPNQWFQLIWFVCVTLLWLMYGGIQQISSGISRDHWLRCVLGLVFALIVRSSILDSPGMGIRELWLGWLSCGMLMAVMLVFWQVGCAHHSARILSTAVSAAAVVAALGSMAVFYFLDDKAVFGMRLSNWFVYGGWNSVCTGMTFGFAAVWSISRWHHALKPLEKGCFLGIAICLVWATLMTMSRGALLALVAGHAALMFSRGWRFSRGPIILLVACIACFQILAPLISQMGVHDLSEQMGRPKLTEAMVSDGVISSNPAKRLITRGDTHRFSIYAAGLSSMTTASDWLLGKGLWAANDSWSCSLPWNPEHLHSVFVDALIRCGVLAFACLVGLLAWGLYRAWWLAQQGEEVWMMLASFGVAGLVFDGDSAFSLLSVPRFETLILWVPLVLASVRYTNFKRDQSGLSHSEVPTSL
jgi:hypothetical protein